MTNDGTARMQMVFHLGVHGTDGDRLLKTLLNNRDWLLRNETEIVSPARHRGLLEEAMMALNGAAATPEMQQIMLDAMLETEAPQRVVMSSPTLLGTPARAVSREGLYPQIGSRSAALAGLFADAHAEFFVAIRNPAVLLSKLTHLNNGGYAAMMQGADPRNLRWRDTIQRLVRSAQGRRVVIWCHEDVPLIWPELVRLIGDIPPEAPLSGALLYMQELLGEAGMARLNAELGGRDQLSIAQRREIQTAILQDQLPPDAADEEINLPGWTQDLVDQITRDYHADVAEIAVLPGVEFVLP
ncbi:hypothetical protein MU516_07210 [Paracoccus sp. YLB-12]|uniref:Sulfotransferase family protein n=1 Tax=Paracoccus maritimus TaxID=2933292 RepID=A0ABT2K9K1_9RHOB|nr:hypothetical protein [Paracoccus sp. YLB-12]MCT4332654.1 hypothetical protein [Paracoccus sp. YLB-12]